MTQLGRRLRIAILERDGYRCVYCGRTPPAVMLEVDHVVARALGGLDEPQNLVTACEACNGGKNANPVALPDPLVLLRPLPEWYLDRRPTPMRRNRRLPGPAYPGCDLCHRVSDTVHWLPWVVLAEGTVPTVLFACSDHDPGGYWLPTGRLESERDHIERKQNGHLAIIGLDDRLAGGGIWFYAPVSWRSTDTQLVVRAWYPETGARPLEHPA